ncbi:hypothetical protein DESC_740235 [Desulfosarcina cetonica]|nr:hypothetical protein DESC_740235 [Desulfosarcina cetonica]
MVRFPSHDYALDDHANRGGHHGSDDDIGVARDRQRQAHGGDAGDDGGEQVNPFSDLVDQQADEHGDEGVIDAQGTLGDKPATDAAGHGAEEPGEVGRVVDHHGSPKAPLVGIESGEVDGKTFVGHTIGVEGEQSPVRGP